MALSRDLLDVLEKPAICLMTTLMPDGSPQITQTWVDTDGEHVLINTVDIHQKTRNITRDPRVAIGIVDPDMTMQSWGLRGTVVSTTTEGADEHVEKLSHKYLGRSYPGYGDGGGKRVILTIDIDKVHAPFGG